MTPLPCRKSLIPFIAAVTLAFAGPCLAAEVDSPEQFMLQRYGWTLKGMDGERGLFGKHKRFACFDDRLAPSEEAAQMAKRRWGTECQTVRNQSENLTSMLFVTWVNPNHAKPITREEYETFVARGMAGKQKDDGVEPRCTSQPLAVLGHAVDSVNCAMVLPFGTYYASYIRFEHRGVGFYVRSQNASNQPSETGPTAAIADLLTRLQFE